MNCVACKANLGQGMINHIVDVEGQIIIIKNVPAQVCSQCGEYYLEHQVAINLEHMIEDSKKTRAEVSIINYFDRVA
jgi:YgiT-type zinc finger domain-containing protein